MTKVKSPKKSVPKATTKTEEVEDELNQSHKPIGIPSLLCLVLAVYLCWTSNFQSENIQFGICFGCCIIASGRIYQASFIFSWSVLVLHIFLSLFSAYVFFFKMSLRPTSVFILTALCSILNAIAFGRFFPYKYYVICTSPISLIQTLLLLPLKMPDWKSKNKHSSRLIYLHLKMTCQKTCHSTMCFNFYWLIIFSYIQNIDVLFS